MGYPLRNRDPKYVHLVTNRTVNAQLLLRPSKDVNRIIGGVFARYQEIFQIEIYALIVLSNHYHLLVRSPLGNLDAFMENVNREIARRMNFKLHRQGDLWKKRYHDVVLVTFAEWENALLYIMANATRHGVDRDPHKWPGINTYKQILSGCDKIYPFHHYSAKKGEPKVTYHKLTITPLPGIE